MPWGNMAWPGSIENPASRARRGCYNETDPLPEAGLADRIGGPLAEDAAREVEVVDRDQGRLVQRIAECR